MAVKKAEEALKKAKLALSNSFNNCSKKTLEKSKKAVVEIKKKIEVKEEVPVETKLGQNQMGDNACFFIKSLTKDSEGREYAMTTLTKDKYAPKHVTGIYNIEMDLLDTGKPTNE